MEGLAMFGKRILLAIGISLAVSSAALAQQGGPTKPPPTHSVHVGHDVCKTHPNLPQCK
jgi:hypothetical protein